MLMAFSAHEKELVMRRKRDREAAEAEDNRRARLALAKLAARTTPSGAELKHWSTKPQLTLSDVCRAAGADYNTFMKQYRKHGRPFAEAMARARGVHHRNYRSWSNEDEEALLSLRAVGHTFTEISDITGIPATHCRCHWHDIQRREWKKHAQTHDS